MRRLIAVGIGAWRRRASGLALAMLLSLIIGACSVSSSAPLQHEVYIWQRLWTPALVASLGAARGRFAGWRVLAAESTETGGLVDASPRLDALAKSGLPVIAVLRWNGSRPPPAIDTLVPHLQGLIAAWRGAGVKLTGIEVDHDCATSRLDRYALLLQQLRAALPQELHLSITALPTWIGAPALGRVLAQADHSVLQVHAVTAPRVDERAAGLFDAAQARGWIHAYAAIASVRAFSVALPAYGLRVGFDDEGRTVAVEAEASRDIEAAAVRELSVDPAAVAAFLRELEWAHPRSLDGVVWFRLPSAEDRRAWSLRTLFAVIAGQPLQPDLAVRMVSSASGASDVILANRGTLDASLPEQLDVAATGCVAADGLGEYRAEQRESGWRFVLQKGSTPGNAILRAGRERPIGWVRCKSQGGVTIHERP